MGELLFLLAGSGAGAWALLCALAPDYPCKACAGTGHRMRLVGRSTVPCRSCDGVGRRRRMGAGGERGIRR